LNERIRGDKSGRLMGVKEICWSLHFSHRPGLFQFTEVNVSRDVLKALKVARGYEISSSAHSEYRKSMV